MAKKKAYAHDDKALMMLAGVAAIIVGFFAIFTYKTKSSQVMPTPNPITTIDLNTQNKSGEKGTAILQEINGKILVTLTMTGFVENITQPAHIHIGSCPAPGAVKYPLTSVVDGSSTTTLDVTLSELQKMGPLALNVHKSVPSVSTYVSCGDLKF